MSFTSLKNQNPQEKTSLSCLAEKWASTFVAREKVSEFSGGILTARYLANLDSQGKGPERITIGRKVCYPVGSLVSWLEKRIKTI